MGLRLCFFLRHAGAIRNFDAVLEELSARDHAVHLVLEMAPRAPSGERLLGRAERLSGLTHGPAPARAGDRMVTAGRALRLASDCLRYLEPAYADAPALRARARLQAPGWGRRLGALPRPARHAAWRMLERLERAMPADPGIVGFLRRQAPDAILLSPLVDFGSPQAEYVRAARSLDLPSALLLHSWDNLSNKGLIHEAPDLVTVWNDALRDEAVGLHGVPAERVAVTGAATYDHWFDWDPSSSRDEHVAGVGLDPARPYVLWMCSSPFIAPGEVDTVKRVVAGIRADDRLCGVQLLVRPHPQNAKQWRAVELGEGTAVWPRAGADPVDQDARRDYFDSIHHSAAVAGINTSALIESAIVGRSVHTLGDAHSRDTQEGTLHFRMLAAHSRGFLRRAARVEELTDQVAAVLASPPPRDEGFLRSFVRPGGLEEPAAPRVVDAIESVCGYRAEPARALSSSL